MPNSVAIFAIQFLHTAVFFVVSGFVLYALRCGVTGIASRRLLQISIALPTLIGVLWRLNGGECILSTAIYRLAEGDRTVPDILLPTWFARWIMLGSTIVLVVAVCLVLWRQAGHKWRRR